VDCATGPSAPAGPELFVLCDVSTSVTSASVFFLSCCTRCTTRFRKLRSFVFVRAGLRGQRGVRARTRLLRRIAAIGSDAGVADVSGYTDYGRVWVEFLEMWWTTWTRAPQ